MLPPALARAVPIRIQTAAMNGARIAFIVIGVVSVIAIIGGLIGGAFSVLEPTEYVRF